MTMVHASRGKLPPASKNLRSEPAIVAGMALATLPATKVDWRAMLADYSRIRDAIESVFPDFRDYNQRIQIPGGFRLPLPPTELKWPTPSGRAQFIVFDGLEEDLATVAPKILRLTTIRSHDQYNTTIYGMDDRYRGVFGRRDVVFMNAADLAANGLAHGDTVTIETAFDNAPAARLEGFLAIAHDIARGSAAAYYPEANGLVPLSHYDKKSGTPSYKSVPVRIRKQK